MRSSILLYCFFVINNQIMIRKKSKSNRGYKRRKNFKSSGRSRRRQMTGGSRSKSKRHNNSVAPQALLLGIGALGVAYGLRTKKLAEQTRTEIANLTSPLLNDINRQKFLLDIEALSYAHNLKVTDQQSLIDNVNADISNISTEMTELHDMTNTQLFRYVSELYTKTASSNINPDLNLLIDELHSETKINNYLTTATQETKQPNLILIDNFRAVVKMENKKPTTFIVPTDCLLTIIYVLQPQILNLEQIINLYKLLKFNTINLTRMLQYMFMSSNELKPIVLSYVAGNEVLDKLYTMRPNDTIYCMTEKIDGDVTLSGIKNESNVDITQLLSKYVINQFSFKKNLVVLDLSSFNNGQSNKNLLKSLTITK